jgi:hypothetical protein
MPSEESCIANIVLAPYLLPSLGREIATAAFPAHRHLAVSSPKMQKKYKILCGAEKVMTLRGTECGYAEILEMYTASYRLQKLPYYMAHTPRNVMGLLALGAELELRQAQEQRAEEQL